MWRKNTGLLLVLTFTSALLSPNCATLTRQKTQAIPVTSVPAGARVIVNGVDQGATPIEIRLLRSTKVQVIRIESPGYDPAEIRPQRRISRNPIFGNILLGLACASAIPIIRASGFDTGEMGAFYLGIGLRTVGFAGLFEALDLSLKKGHEFQPRGLMLTLKRADGPPRVDTTIIDAGDFQRIKWIRVHKN